MTAPRIDTIRREINDAQTVLGYLAANLEDLHALAYEKHHAGQAERTRGGQRDYALDNHGDPKARALYETIAKAIIGLVSGQTLPARKEWSRLDGLVQLEQQTRGFLTHGKNDPTKIAAVTQADEVVRQIVARRRRIARGEYEPKPIAVQPVVAPSMDWQTECEVLRAAVRKVTAEFAQDHQHCQPPDEGIGRYKRKLLRRYPTKNLSTREREAWRRAQSVADQNEQATA